MRSCHTPNTTYVHWLQAQHGQPELLELLDEKEQQRAASYKFGQHRNLYITAHVFLRKVLSYHAMLPPEDWRFYLGSHGKPYIENSTFQSIQFNLSHTQGMVVCAVNKTYEVGIDVEGPRPLQYMAQMSRRNYSNRECDDIFSNNNSEKRLQRFYTYWTLKESLVKALGFGLSIPLKKIEFIQLSNDSWLLEKDITHHDELLQGHYIFNHIKMPNNYQIAVSVNTKEKNNTFFCLIDSNHTNINQWKHQK